MRAISLDAVGVADVLGGGERFGVGGSGFGGGEAHETAFEHIERDLISGGEEVRQLASVGGGRLAFFDLRDAFVEPSGAAVARHLRDERVRQFMFEDAGQFGRDALDAADRDAQFAIVDGAGP